MDIRIKRVYEGADPEDGTRILVDRLWPRGLSKEVANVDHWAKDVSPSNELRRWYGHDPDKWVEFQKRYAAELDGKKADLDQLMKQAAKGPVTFLYSSTERRLNNAAALKIYLEKMMRKPGTR